MIDYGLIDWLISGVCVCGGLQALQPHVRVWDSVSLSTLQIIGLGTFERGVGSLAFSKAVSMNPLTAPGQASVAARASVAASLA